MRTIRRITTKLIRDGPWIHIQCFSQAGTHEMAGAVPRSRRTIPIPIDEGYFGRSVPNNKVLTTNYIIQRRKTLWAKRRT